MYLHRDCFALASYDFLLSLLFKSFILKEKQIITHKTPLPTLQPYNLIAFTMSNNVQNNNQNAGSRRFYNRCFAHFANAAKLNRTTTHQQQPTSSNTSTNDGNDLLRWIVQTRKLRKANIQSFYIIDTPSRLLPEPCLHLTGSYGNEYKVMFASNNISCTCDDTTYPCKHILFIIQKLGQKITVGLNIIDPLHILHLLESVPLNHHLLDQKTSNMCLSYTVGKCGICQCFLKGTSATCHNCAFVVHNNCIPDKPFSCPQCHQRWVGIQIPFHGKHRNFYNILRHSRYPVSQIPAKQTYKRKSQISQSARPIRQRQPVPPQPLQQPFPPPPQPHFPNNPLPPNLALPDDHSSTAHLIPRSPDKQIQTKFGPFVNT